MKVATRIDTWTHRMIAPMLVAIALLGAGGTPAAAEGSPEEGKRVFRQCGICHAVSADEGAKIGPHLQGLFGRESGTLESFQRYSPAMRKSDIVWTEETLDRYLANPQKMVPGTSMAFAGVRNDQQRQDLIAYLKQATQ